MMEKEYLQMDVGQQRDYRSKNAVRFIQSQAPCSNVARKRRG